MRVSRRCRRRCRPSLGRCRGPGWAAIVPPRSLLWDVDPCAGSSTTALGPRTTSVLSTPEPPQASLFRIFIPTAVDYEEAEGDYDRHQLPSPTNTIYPRLEGVHSCVHEERMPRNAGGRVFLVLWPRIGRPDRLSNPNPHARRAGEDVAACAGN